MNIKHFLTLCLIASNVCHAQQIRDSKHVPVIERPRSAEEWRLYLVKRLMSMPSPVTNGAVQLHGMGDEAAVDVIKVLSERPTLTLAEIQATLDIIAMAFERPGAILNTVNVEPHVALFLLQHLGTMTNDSEITQRLNKQMSLLRAFQTSSQDERLKAH